MLLWTWLYRYLFVLAKSLQLCPTLCNPMDCSPPGSSVCGIPDKDAGVGCHFLLQGVFPTQGSTSHLLSPALSGRFSTTSATWETQTLLSVHPEMALLDHMCVLFIFGGTAIPFSTAAVPSYILTSCVEGLQFLHVLAIVCCFLDFWWSLS